MRGTSLIGSGPVRSGLRIERRPAPRGRPRGDCSVQPLRKWTGKRGSVNTYSGNGDAYVAKINLYPLQLSYSTFLGGRSVDAARSIAVDSAGAAYVTGVTYSDDLETANPIQGPSNPDCCPSGFPDVFIARLASDADDVLARRYQPVLRFDEGERWRPLDVDRMLTDEYHYVCRSRCSRLTSFSQLADYPSSSAYIDIGAVGDPGPAPRYSDPDHYYSPVCPPNGGQVMDCESGSRSAIYYDTSKVSPSGYRYIQYWIFYRFNDSPADQDPFSGEYLDHEADWEQMAVAIPSGTALSAPTFDFANFGQHGNNFTYLRENLTCDGGSSCGPTAKHVHSFVSGGTHATYGEPCSGIVPCFQSNSEIPETDHGGEVAWANNGDASALRRLPAPFDGQWRQGPHAWVDWPGWWGLDQGLTADHVASPANQSFYDYPWDAECVDSGCQPQSSSVAAVQPESAITATSDDCAQWFGSGIAVASCDSALLKETLETASVGEHGGTVDLTLERKNGRSNEAATTRGLAQLAAKPLRPGDRVPISGPTDQRGTIFVRAWTNRRLSLATFSERQLADRRTITVKRRGSRAIPKLHQSGRRSLPPRSLTIHRMNGDGGSP